MKKQKKPKSRRPQNASLIRKYNPRIRQEYLDQDYLDKLNPEEMAWLAKFMSEWNGASFNHDETDIDQSDEGYKASNDRNNQRNRDLYGMLKNKADKVGGANRRLVSYESLIPEIEEELSKGMSTDNVENAYINYLDSKQVEQFLMEYDVAMASFKETLFEVLEPGHDATNNSNDGTQNL